MEPDQAPPPGIVDKLVPIYGDRVVSWSCPNQSTSGVPTDADVKAETNEESLVAEILPANFKADADVKAETNEELLVAEILPANFKADADVKAETDEELLVAGILPANFKADADVKAETNEEPLVAEIPTFGGWLRNLKEKIKNFIKNI